MKKLTFLFVFFAVLVCQAAEKMDRNAAARAWAAVSFPLPYDTPSITGGGLIIESEVNGIGRKVWLTATQSGTYLLRGETCGGDEVKLGELGWEINPYNPTMTVMVFDAAAMVTAMPFFPQICALEAVRLNGGKVERLVVDVNPWQMSSPVQKLQIGEGVSSDGRYYISTAPLPPDAIAIVGRSAVGEIQTTPFGSVVVLPVNTFLPSVGTTTLTICRKGRCETTTFERKLVVETPGKG